MLLGLVGGAFYLFWPTIQGWFGRSPQTKKTKRAPRPTPASPSKAVAPGSPSKPTFEDEWVPDLHKKQPKVVKHTGRGNAAELLSGSEAEATDGSTGRGRGGKKKRTR